MVFIHPVILRDAAVMNNYTNSKYNYIRTLQLGQHEDGVNLLLGETHPVLPVMEEVISESVAVPEAQTESTAVQEEGKDD